MQTNSYQGDGRTDGGVGWMQVAFRLTAEQASFWGYEEGAWMVIRTCHRKGQPEGSWNITWRVFT